MPVYSLEILVVLLGIGLLLAEAFFDKLSVDKLAVIAIGGLAFVLSLFFFVSLPEGNELTNGIYKFYATDGLALFYKGFALVTTMLVLYMALHYRKTLVSYVGGEANHRNIAEFYSLPIFVCAGLMLMASAKDLITIFVSLEVVTVAFYILVAYMRRNVGSLEAGVKYLVLGALSTGFLVYGITWTFGLTGSFDLAEIGNKLSVLQGQDKAIIFAFVLLMTALGFKIAAAPFQWWVPDVYQGAATPITAFLSVGSKAAGIVVLTRVLQPFLNPLLSTHSILLTVLFVMVVATLIFGNLAAIGQHDFKRLMAYSSIAHAGFLLLALTSRESLGGMGSVQVVSFYMATYLFASMVCFLILTYYRENGLGEKISSLHGMARTSPFLAFVLLVAMASLAGIPFTGGFMAKAMVFFLAFKSQYYAISAVAIVMAVAAFYYYFKVIRAMYWDVPNQNSSPAPLPLTLSFKLVLGTLTAGTFLLGICPTALPYVWQPTFFGAKVESKVAQLGR